VGFEQLRLGRLDGGETLQGFIQGEQDGDPAIRQAIVEAVPTMGPASLD
jgi:hypothetical protein